MSDPYNTTTGNKQRCRERLVEAIQVYLGEETHKSMLLLPSKEAHDAYLLLKHWPKAKIVALERDGQIFEEMDKNHPFHIEHKDVREYVDSEKRAKNPRQFNFAFLDYFGPAKSKTVHEVVEFAKYLTHDNCVIGLTFQKSSRGSYDEIAEIISDNAWLEEAEEKSANRKKTWVDGLIPTSNIERSQWNNSFNVANAICSLLDRMLVLKEIKIIESFEYRADEENNSTVMFFMIIYIEKLNQ